MTASRSGPAPAILGLLTIGLLSAAAGCGGGKDEACKVDASYAPAVDPARFTASTAIDNPLMPLPPGAVRVLENDTERITIVVSTVTRVSMGIECVVVSDVVRLKSDGSLVEETFDWYAQDDDGNVWYFGEDTREYEGGEVVSTEGTWEAGVDGALPGVVMWAAASLPPAAQPYRQEYFACEAEDMAEVVATGQAVTVPAGTFSGCLQTREFTPLEPDVNEWKWACPGVGVALEEDVATGARTELVEATD